MTDATTDAERGQVATEAAEVYQDFFVPALFGQWPPVMLDAAGVSRGHRVLDVGCGTGVLARAAADRVGADHVVGLDVNDGMLAVAARTEPAITWRRGAAESIPFEAGSFDRVLSQFVLMFLEDRAAAVREIARVLGPAGRAAVGTWSAVEENPGYDAMVGLLRKLFGDDHANALLAPFCLGDEAELRSLMVSALDDVDVVRHEGTARFASIDAWVHTDIRGWTLADMVDDHQFEELLRAARVELARFTDASGGVSFPALALVATGTRPVP